MDGFLLLLSLVPMVGLNVWHGILLSRPSKGTRPQSVSEHAASTEQQLFTHRVVHIAGSIVLMVFGLGYLLPHAYVLAGWLLIVGAVFDIIEVLTLNKKSAAVKLALNYHVVTAWTMALCYLLYASVIVRVAHLPTTLIACIWASFVTLLIVSFARKFKDFWITQHLYFCFLALVMATAHIKLFV